MEHFSVVQTLCRVGLEQADDQFRKQVQRLRDRLAKAGETKEAEALERLLETVSSEVMMAPSVVEVSRSLVFGEELTSNVFAPADRETGVPLAEISLTPGEGRPEPIYGETLKLALSALLEEWRHPERLRRQGVEPSLSCLLYGPPGTGKTLTAVKLASRVGLPVVNARIDGLVSSFLGTTARNIANLFDFANRYRCVLVLDEFDALAKMRDDPHELGELKRVVNTLLQNLDARAERGLTIAITNHEGLLDPAVWRRFQNHIRIDLPDVPERVEMLRTFLKPISLTDDVYRTLAYIIGQKSGSDLKTFADAIRRTLAMTFQESTPPAIMNAARAALARLGVDGPEMVQAREFLGDKARFVGAITNAGLGIKQESLAQMFESSQSNISRWSNEWKAAEAEVPNAE
jgi:hypothetical protein